MNKRAPAASEERSDFKVFFRVALGGCLGLAALLLGAIWWSNRIDSTVAVEEVSRVRAALAEEGASLASRLRAYAAAAQLPVSTKGFAVLHGPFAHLFLIDPAQPEGDLTADNALFRAALGSLGEAGALHAASSLPSADLRGPIGAEMTDEPAAQRGPRADVVAVGGRAFISVNMDVAAAAAGPLDLVALEAIDEPVLGRLARKAGTPPLSLVPNATPANGYVGLSLSAPPGAPGLSLVWRPDRPGELVFRFAGTTLAGFGALFAAFVVLRARRMTQDLLDSEARARADAAQDMLTGLPNRIMFNRLLEAEVSRVSRGSARGLAVLYLDIDRFKSINDTFGHQAGDRVIKAIGERLSRTLRANGRVARIAGDEFAIIQTDVESPRDCAHLAQRILDAFREPIDIGEMKLAATLSIGVALCPHDAKSPDALTHSADLALYRAKSEGRNRYCFFEHLMGEELRMRRIVEDELRTAIETNQLIMSFQPVMALDGRRMLGVEALVRWQHPVRGTISPTSFITLAEECGLILPLGEWVLRTALREVRRWPGLRVAVNVSAIQFRQKDFPNTVQRLLAESGVEASQLELELTESVLLADADQAEDAMIELRAMGVRLALDDFGTGYSSLIYLRRFAFDKIKIDRSFLESMESTGESAIIVHSIVHLGRALGLTVTAEGIETRDQHRFLQALGCHELQGYLFSPPVPADEIDRMLVSAPATPLKSVA
jgi:diguanylate cyclase (GGDEF)-like protein